MPNKVTIEPDVAGSNQHLKPNLGDLFKREEEKGF